MANFVLHVVLGVLCMAFSFAAIAECILVGKTHPGLACWAYVACLLSLMMSGKMFTHAADAVDIIELEKRKREQRKRAA